MRFFLGNSQRTLTKIVRNQTIKNHVFNPVLAVHGILFSIQEQLLKSVPQVSIGEMTL